MSRPIKFRGQRLGSKEWVYGDLIKHSKVDPFTYIAIGTGYKIDDPELGTAIKVYPNTVGQFVGLTDSDETDIFEEDILAFVDDPFDSDTKKTGLVRWNDRDCAYRIWFSKTSYTFLTSDNKEERGYKIIGSIHANPELLGEISET